MRNQTNPKPEDSGKPLSTRKYPPLPPLPEREWLNATIVDVAYRFVTRNGQIQYMTDKDDNPIIDEDTKLTIPRKEFAVSFYLTDYALPGGDGKPRQAWLNLGASLGEKAHLPTFLANCGIDIDTENPLSPDEIVESLLNLDVRLQVGSVKVSEKNGKSYQNVIWDAVKVVPKPTIINAPAVSGAPVKPVETVVPVRLGPDGQEIAWDEEG